MALKTSIQNVCRKLGYSVQELPNIIKALQEGFAAVATEAGDVDAAVTDVGTLKTRMTTAEGKITTLEGKVSTLEQGKVYSGQEHVYGKWADGRTIYEMTQIFVGLPNATTTAKNHGIQNIREVVSAEAMAIKSNSYILMPNSSIGYEITNTQTIITTTTDMSAYNAYITIRYTKTS